MIAGLVFTLVLLGVFGTLLYQLTDAKTHKERLIMRVPLGAWILLCVAYFVYARGEHVHIAMSVLGGLVFALSSVLALFSALLFLLVVLYMLISLFGLTYYSFFQRR